MINARIPRKIRKTTVSGTSPSLISQFTPHLADRWAFPQNKVRLPLPNVESLLRVERPGSTSSGNEDEVMPPPPNVASRSSIKSCMGCNDYDMGCIMRPSVRGNAVMLPPPNVESLLHVERTGSTSSGNEDEVMHTHSFTCRHILDSGGLFLPPSDQKIYDKAMTIYCSAMSRIHQLCR
jgi:hypothetical protein